MEDYKQYKQRLAAEQAGKSKDEVMSELKAEYKLDLDNLPRQQHNWIERGLKVSCEGANHPHHSHFLVTR